MLRAAGVPYWRLSSVYFFYFALLGAWLPFWNLYLADRGFDADTIGLLSAITMGTKVIAPALWSWLAEKLRRHILFIQLGSALTLATVLLVLLEPTSTQMVAVVFIYSFFWNAVLPQFEAVTVEHLGEHTDRYSEIRLWGSVGFIVAVLILGWVFDWLAITYLPWFFVAILVALTVSSFSITEPASWHGQEPSVISIKELFRCRILWAFMAAMFFQQLSHGPYYAFFSLHLETFDYSKFVIGLLWALGVVAEIVLFMVMARLLPMFGLKSLLVVALLLSVLRWVLIAYLAHSWPVMIFAQILHAASFGVCHAAAVDYIRQHFSAAPALGQAVYNGVSFGLGGAIGALLSGWIWHLGGHWVFVLSALASLFAVILVIMFYSEASVAEQSPK